MLRNETDARKTFIVAWCAVLAVKCVLAMHLPLFVDEAFYWQEGMHPAWAYSDLPGLTAWLTRIGVALFGHDALGLELFKLFSRAAQCADTLRGADAESYQKQHHQRDGRYIYYGLCIAAGLKAPIQPADQRHYFRKRDKRAHHSPAPQHAPHALYLRH